MHASSRIVPRFVEIDGGSRAVAVRFRTGFVLPCMMRAATRMRIVCSPIRLGEPLMRRPLRSRSIFFAALPAVMLSACTTTGIRSVSSQGSPTEGAAEPPLGVSYYLPMRYAKVTFTRVKADDKADKAFAEATAALKDLETKLAGAKAAAAAQASLLEAMKKISLPMGSGTASSGVSRALAAALTVTETSTSWPSSSPPSSWETKVFESPADMPVKASSMPGSMPPRPTL